MISTHSSTAPDEIFHKWTPAWSPDHTDPSLPPVTLITDTHDQPAYTTTALAAHQPEHGRIAVHPTPLATAPAYLAHDLIRALGKHLPAPHIDPPWWTSNADESWRVAVAWTQALNISHYVICRAHRITGRHLEHLMALRERTRIRLTLVVSGPAPAALSTTLNTVAHHQIDSIQDTRQHLNADQAPTPRTLASYAWWQRAPFPGPHDESWYELPPRPRRPAGKPDEVTSSTRGTPTRLSSTDSQPPAIALQTFTRADTSSAHLETVAQRIHTRVAHPVHAAAVALRALTGYGTDQLAQLTIPTPHRPRADLPTDLPDWARLLRDAARIHTDLQGYIRHDLTDRLSGEDTPFRLSAWDKNDVAHATETCHLVAARVRRARQRP
ncbi:hypothetical protein ABZ920_01485 [Streptomyces sp. NPDC046831]|uniref:hypothetical protein n=1 Tax=Streptomyces sp. NPDC046831 TaxID=3154805 RepID=UPI0034106744